jgi:hypothetical protein
MKYIRIILRDKREITLSFEKAENLLDHPNQIVRITDEEGKWTGEAINKSEIIWTQRDTDRERQEKQKELDKNALPEAEPTTQPNMHDYMPEFIKKRRGITD